MVGRFPLARGLVAMDQLAEITARVAVMENKIEWLIKISTAVLLPVYVQFINMLIRKAKGGRAHAD